MEMISSRRREFRVASTALLASALGIFLSGCIQSDELLLEADMVNDALLVEGAETACISEGSTFGAWTVRFTGYGCVRLARDDDETARIEMAPRAVNLPSQTSASLVLGPEFEESYRIALKVRTDRQLRRGMPPNPWEVAWIAWDYSSDAHFYYFALKTNGWELGKRDPEYIGGQRFLATGSAPFTVLRRWYDVEIRKNMSDMSVFVDGSKVVQYRDEEEPYIGGRLALYSEDAQVSFADIRAVR